MTALLRRRWVLVLVSLGLLGADGLASGITRDGQRLEQALDSLDVEHLWLPGRAIHWRSGTVDHRGHQGATHCSAFVAAACDRLGIYILRPPEHSQTLLANAQNAWLREVGPRFGWRRVDSAERAQELANLGMLVVVSYRNPNRHRPGHIAIVRPADKPPWRFEDEGPQVIQAGATNARSISLKRGFRHHPDAWPGRAVDFFAHPVAWETSSTPTPETAAAVP